MSSAAASLVGREAEIGVVGRFLAGAAVDGGGLVLTGPAGIGRTTLLDVAATMAADVGALVVRAAGAQDEADLPFAGLSQLLAPLGGAVERLDPGHRAILLAVLGPDAGHDGDGRQRPVDGDAVTAALAAALEVAADDRPVVIAVDDLPEIDASSTACLRSLARAVPGRRIGLLATATTAAVHGWLPERRLAPLDDGAAAALLAARVPQPDRADRDRLLRAAQGNPLALRELPLRAGGALGPRLASLFGARLAALPEHGRRLLLRAALADSDDLDLLLGEGVPVPEELNQAERAGLVALVGRSVLFAHPAVPATILATATAGERRRAHAVLADAFVDRPDRRLWHRSAAVTGPDDDTARALEGTALHLLARGDAAGAMAALRRGAGLTWPGAARARRAARSAYLDAAVGGELDAAAGLPGPTGGGPLWATAARAHLLLHGDGDLDAAHRLLVDAMGTGADPDVEPGVLTAALDTLLTICRIADRAALWSQFHALAARHAERVPVAVRYGAHQPPGDQPDPVETVRAGWSLLDVDDVGRRAGDLHRVLDDGRRGGAAGSAMSAAALLALDAFAAGRWDDTHRLARQGQALCASHAHETLAVLAAAGPALVAACRGEEVACREHTSRMIGWAAPRGARLVHHYATHARVLVALGQGDAESAYHLARGITPPGAVGPGGAGRRLVMDLVEAAVRTQRHDAAAAHVRAAQRAGIAEISARSALLVAGAAALTEQGDRARSWYEQALAVPGVERFPFDVARVRLAYGEHLRRSRATLAARQQLTTSLAIFRRLGAHPWTARTESELRAAGHRVLRARGTASTALSHQEQTVARLAATGATNRQIGERLGISPRTVSSHLAGVFRKLGVTSRAALGEAMRADVPT